MTSPAHTRGRWRGRGRADACLHVLAISVFVLLASALSAQQDVVQSRVIETPAGELVLLQEVLLDAPRSDVWAAYTSSRGWQAWAAPVAEVDLRQGGTIRTHYDGEAALGDPGTNVLHIVNYVPENVLTLRAELSERWPEVMKQDHGRLMNVIVFDELSSDRTRVRSFGVGYRDVPEYEELLQFFVPANEQLLVELKKYVEQR